MELRRSGFGAVPRKFDLQLGTTEFIQLEPFSQSQTEKMADPNLLEPATLQFGRTA